jgi:lipopolysaccharide/colanic/teichoic acid biosynthesis glycosyltransferase
MASALTTSSLPAVRSGRPVELRLASNIEVQSNVSANSRTVMRVIDVVAASLLLVLLSPVMAVVAILVKRSSPGPVIFRQERIGKDGRLFDVFKFRSMAAGTDVQVLNDPELRRRYEENNFKLDATDPRITRVGRVIRRTSLDELPQLVNVLRGEMSLVGVRPLLARELALRSPYDQELYALHRPGLTGLWQVEGRSSVGHEDRADLDRRYLEDWSAPANVGLLVRTPRAVLLGAGAH